MNVFINETGDPAIFDLPMVGRYECWREPVVADGTAQAQATDQSGNGNDAVQATGASQPLYKTNRINTTLPAWQFDGVNDWLLTPSIPAMNNVATRWYYLVANFLSEPAIGAAMGAENTGCPDLGDLVYHLAAGNQSVMRYGTSAGSDNFAEVTGPVTWRAYKIVLDGTTVTRQMSGGGVEDVEAQVGSPPNGTFRLLLGALEAGVSTFGHCDIAALFMGNAPLSATDIARIEAYILDTYGLSF